MQISTKRSIFNEHWDEIDNDADVLHMNRSEFIDFLYRYWKNKHTKPTLIEVLTLFGLVFIMIMIIILVIK